MKTFHLIKGLHRGGVESLIMDWYRHIDRAQYTFDFGVTTLEAREFADEIQSYGGHILHIAKGNTTRQKLTYLWRLYKTLKQNGPYHSFFSHEQFFGSVTCAVAWVAGIKKRITVAHWGEDYHKPFYIKWISHWCSRLFVTDRLAVSWPAGRVQFGKLPFTVICTGINTQQFAFNVAARTELRNQLHLAENNFVLGNVSRLSADKNLYFLVDVFKEIHKQLPQAVLLQCGDGDFGQSFKEYIAKQGLNDSVRLIGKTTEIFKYYQAMDAFVFPSFKEGLGIVVVEAQCAGLPCFVSDGVPQEAIICNTVQIPLAKSAQEWAQIILEKTRNFVRADHCEQVKRAGFDIRETARQIEKEYVS